MEGMTAMLDIRKGKKTNTAQGMTDLSYFRPVAKPGFEEFGIEDAFRTVYGEQPRMIKAYLAGESVDDVWQWAYEEWNKGGLVHRCDGEFVTRYKTGNEYVDPAPGEMLCPYHSGQRERTSQRPGCRPSGRLQIFPIDLIDLLEEEGVSAIGVAVVKTTSIYDCLHIDEFLKAIEKQQRAAGKTIFGFELLVRRVKKEIKMSWGGGSKREERWMIQLAEPASFALQRLRQAREQQLIVKAAEVEAQYPDVDPDTGEIAPEAQEEPICDEADAGVPEPPKSPGNDGEGPQEPDGAEDNGKAWSSEDITEFFQWAKSHKLTPPAALQKLGVSRLDEYDGTPKEAREAITNGGDSAAETQQPNSAAEIQEPIPF